MTRAPDVDAFDADALVYAAEPGHPLGRLVLQLFLEADVAEPVGVGSVLLRPELLSKPLRTGERDEAIRLRDLLSRLELLPCDEVIAVLATELGATYGLRAADAVHLATAVNAGADRFVTNNQRDFPKDISEIEIVYPPDLDAA